MILAVWAANADLIAELKALPDHLAKAAATDWPALRSFVPNNNHGLTLGRGPTFSIACEAALKLNETCAIHAKAYSAA